MLVEIPDEYASSVLFEIESRERAKDILRQETALYATDDGLNEAIKNNHFREFNGMIGRKKDYRDWEEIRWTTYYTMRVFRQYESELGDLCPVVMRGSRWVLHRTYSKTLHGDHPNGWHERVARRYIKMSKHSSVGYDEARKKLEQKIEQWANARHNTWGKFTNPAHIGSRWAWIEGERYWMKDLDTQRALKTLLKHVHKLENIDACAKRITQ